MEIRFEILKKITKLEWNFWDIVFNSNVTFNSTIAESNTFCSDWTWVSNSAFVDLI